MIHVTALQPRRGRHEMLGPAQSQPRAPEEVDILWLIEEFLYVRALVGRDRDTQLLVFERDASISVVDEFGYSASPVAIVMVALVAHFV